MLRFPGVYRPQDDTALLCRAVRRAAVPAGTRVLDVCSGTGRVALGAAARGAAQVTAVDVSRRAVLSARLNAALLGVSIRVRQGDLFGPVAGEEFDLITANPPYVPRRTGRPGRHGRSRAWDAGPHGREKIDRICSEAPVLLAPRGTLLMVHSAVCGVTETLSALRSGGLKAAVVERETIPYGPVMRSRAADLVACGAATPGQDTEELVVIRADRP